MEPLRFTKMHGIGNDYIYIDTFDQAEPDLGWKHIAQRVSDRRFGIGADGMILIEPGVSSGADGRMRMFNADGSESEMCGNGLRCVAKYLHDQRYRGRDTLNLDTGAGCLRVDIIERDDQGEASLVQIDMGLPILDGERVPCTGASEGQAGTLEVLGRSLEYTAVSMGNPHCVIFVDDVKNFPVHELGAAIENNLELFPRRVNVEFVQVFSESECHQRTWERGSGETLACGTGASAVAVAGQLRGVLGKEVDIRLEGGNLKIAWAGPGEPVVMTGPGAYICEGIVHPALLV